MLEEHRAHREGKRGVENPSHRAETPSPGRIEDLLIMVAVIQDMLPQQEI